VSTPFSQVKFVINFSRILLPSIVTNMSFLTKKMVLVLTKGWQVHDTTTPQQALSQMSTNSMVALDITTGESMVPCTWDDWLKLPVREHDMSIKTVRGAIRCPTVVVCASFNKVLTRPPKLSKKAIFERDNGTCQYTGKPIPYHRANLDHVVPSSRGGATSFENIVLSDIKVNSKKDNRTPDEAGLTLLRKPFAPKALPKAFSIRNSHSIPEWDLFLPKAL
jgi:5-methylcytosine-specific restriction endonuclease McrA